MVDYTLAGLDLLLHRIGWSVQVPARQAAERDEEQIAAWKEATWPVIKGRRRTWVSPRFYSARTRTEETCIRLIAGVESLTWVCQLAVRADAILLDKMMK